ncbi:LysM peptidoglycan-binding domain-containing protein [Latilactobacillus sakei]|uniref:LysM peptidoglycan-binding domain-containing protein n=1 Tax=Latilactobacillus sakei TaxID=1599 RepID=UPI00202E1664|nr:LysM peptidoglycan-binding domain-containing protein [Latilactobacillus sakei]MCM1636550.1 LysM peptidoglycan-binding domain-containing protein [Latilactobacillus sakei]
MKLYTILLSVSGGASLFLSAQHAQAATVTVQSGDTVWDLSNKYGSTVQDVIKQNNLQNDGNLIFVDQTLDIPDAQANAGVEAATVSAVKTTPAPAQTPTTTQTSNTQTATPKDMNTTYTQNTTTTQTTNTPAATTANQSAGTYTIAAFKAAGRVTQGTNQFTYYTGAVTADGTHIGPDGKDDQGYYCLAAPSNYPFGTVVQTPLGAGRVHDRGSAVVRTYQNSGQYIDVFDIALGN